MKVVLFGATGMVGQGVLRECLLDQEVEKVLVIGRNPVEKSDPKIEEGIIHADSFDYSAIEDRLKGYDACFFCLGVSSAGMKEAEYRRLTYNLTLGLAKILAEVNPKTTFIYVSGSGTDSSEKGSSMWARIKGETENAILALPFEKSFMFRPAMIRPLHGVKSKTPLYSFVYLLLSPLWPVARLVAPKFVTTTETVGRAMLEVAKHGADKRVLENHELNALVRADA